MYLFRINEVGNRYGKLVVESFDSLSKCGHAKWLCRCDCGGTKVVQGQCLRRGATNSCGCLIREAGRANITAWHDANKARKFLQEVWNTAKKGGNQMDSNKFQTNGGTPAAPSNINGTPAATGDKGNTDPTNVPSIIAPVPQNGDSALCGSACPPPVQLNNGDGIKQR
jgi:hypothetical protein